MWEEHRGKVMPSVLTAIILMAFVGFSGFIIDSVEARAEQWVNKRMDARIVKQNAVIDGKYGKIEERQRTTGEKVDEIEKQIKALNSNLTRILLRSQPVRRN